jgi:uncharacterized protein YcfJ
MNDDSKSLSAAGASASVKAMRQIHPLVAMAAIAVTAVSAIAAYQFLWPQPARSESTRESARDSAGHMSKAAATTTAGAQARASEAVCRECGEVVGIRTQRQEGEGSGLGAVAGGVLGGVLGHQVGAGRGKEAMTVVGAVGGVFAGNEAEKQVKAQTLYLIDVRMADGSQRTVTQAVPPAFAAGTPVRLNGDTIVPR